MREERLGSFTQRHIGTARHFAWLERVVMTILVLNVLDASFTLYWVLGGRAREANPLMDTVIQAHPLLFMIVKLTLVGGGSWLLWHHRKRALAVVAIFVAFLTYYALLLVHLSAVRA